jgi:hypothetical protein
MSSALDPLPLPSGYAPELPLCKRRIVRSVAPLLAWPNVGCLPSPPVKFRTLVLAAAALSVPCSRGQESPKPVAPNNLGAWGSGYHVTRLITYQDDATLRRRLPEKNKADAYFMRLQRIAKVFFAGDRAPETIHIVVMLRPGGRCRTWFVSSRLPGNAPALEPLRKSLEAVPALPVAEGPVLVTISGAVAGGDGGALSDDLRPIPSEWRDIEKGLADPLPVASDAFLDLVWPDTK